jgi:hypothetical protein
MPREMLLNEPDPVLRQVYFHLVLPDGISIDEDEAGGQPVQSKDGGAFTATGISALTHVSLGLYYAVLSQASLNADGSHIETRYETGDGVVIPGDSVDVKAFPGYGAAAALQAAAASLIDSALYGDDANWQGRVILFLTGALKGQGTDVTGYASATKTLTFTATTQAAGAGDAYVIV